MEAWRKGRQSTHSLALSFPHFCRHYKLEKSFFDLKKKWNGMSSPFAPAAVAFLLLQAGGVKSQELQRQKNVGTKIRKQVSWERKRKAKTNLKEIKDFRAFFTCLPGLMLSKGANTCGDCNSLLGLYKAFKKRHFAEQRSTNETSLFCKAPVVEGSLS